MKQLKIFSLVILSVIIVKCSYIDISKGNFYLRIGDMRIIITKTTWKCDRILCPKRTTDRCVVIKRNLPDNQRIVRRENYCYSAENKILVQTVDNQEVGENVFVSSEMTADSDGSMTSRSSLDAKKEK